MLTTNNPTVDKQANNNSKSNNANYKQEEQQIATLQVQRLPLV